MKVEIFTNPEAETPALIGEFDALPRSGEHLAIEEGGYTSYYDVIEVWHRREQDRFVSSLLVTRRD